MAETEGAVIRVPTETREQAEELARLLAEESGRGFVSMSKAVAQAVLEALQRARKRQRAKDRP